MKTLEDSLVGADGSVRETSILDDTQCNHQVRKRFLKSLIKVNWHEIMPV